MEHDEKLDCVGLMCPMPIVNRAKRMKALEQGTVLETAADDEGVMEDVPAWCSRTGNGYLGNEHDGDVIRSYVRKL